MNIGDDSFSFKGQSFVLAGREGSIFNDYDVYQGINDLGFFIQQVKGVLVRFSCLSANLFTLH